MPFQATLTDLTGVGLLLRRLAKSGRSPISKRLGGYTALLFLTGLCNALPALAEDFPYDCPSSWSFPSQEYLYQSPNGVNYTFVFGSTTVPFVPDTLMGSFISGSSGKYVFGTIRSTNMRGIGYGGYIKVHCTIDWGGAPDGGNVLYVHDDGANFTSIIVEQEEESEENFGPCDDMTTCEINAGGGGGSGEGGGGDTGGGELWRFCYWTDYYDENWNYLYSSEPTCHYEWL